MPAAVREQVESDLKPLEAVIVRSILAAWDRWMKHPEKARFRFPRTRANIVFEYITEEAAAGLSAAGVHFHERQETVAYQVNQRTLFRMKKGDQNGVSSNVPTFSALAYVTPDECLIDLPDLQRVDVVYVLNDLATAIDMIGVVARDGDEVEWSYPIYDREESGADLYPLGGGPKPPEGGDPDVLRVPGEDADEQGRA
jgi:hypothetical protein